MLDFQTAGLASIYTMQVCAVDDASDEEILSVCNIENPAGTTNGWSEVIRKDTDRAAGRVPCADVPGRWHYLVQC